MLTPRQLAVVRAALWYWRDEMCPHGEAAARPYLQPEFLPVPSDDEVRQRDERFAPAAVRYAICSPIGRDFFSVQLFGDLTTARRTLRGDRFLATVLLPPSRGT